MTNTEKIIKEVTDELWELIPKDFNYKNIDRKTLHNWLQSRLEYSIAQAIAEDREKVVGEIKEFRHKHRNLNVSSEFDIAFDNFLASLDKPAKE